MEAAGVLFVRAHRAGSNSFEQASKWRVSATRSMFKAALAEAAGQYRLVQSARTVENLHWRRPAVRPNAPSATARFTSRRHRQSRHIEMQVLADEHGNTVYLGARCSLQRRHQKVLEEAPSPRSRSRHATPDGRGRRPRGKAANYTMRARFEFLVDQQKNFYFLEMNTRLQWSIPSPNWSQASIWCTCRSASPRERSCRSRKPTFHLRRPCHGMPHLRRRSRQQPLPQPRKDHAPDRAHRARNPPRHGMYEGWTRGPRLRSAPG